MTFVPQTVCPYRSHRDFWRSIHGPHLICATCHPPARPGIVDERIRVDERPETIAHATSVGRAHLRNELHLLNRSECKRS